VPTVTGAFEIKTVHSYPIGMLLSFPPPAHVGAKNYIPKT